MEGSRGLMLSPLGLWLLVSSFSIGIQGQGPPTSGITPPFRRVSLYACDFEGECAESLIKVTNNNGYEWKRHQGPSPSPGSGPNADHTYGNASGHYMYAASEGNVASGATAWMQTNPPLSHFNIKGCVEFWYHMWGSGTGLLRLIYMNGGQDKVEWSQQGDAGNIWQKANVEINTRVNQEFRVQFEAVSGPSPADIAIDDVQIFSGPCPRDQTPSPAVGTWGEWLAWSACPVTCGGGVIARSRSCLRVPCEGSDVEEKLCAEQPCLTAGEWGSWSDWPQCPVTCGTGNILRYRRCITQPCRGDAAESRACAENACPPAAGWSAWSEWSCSVTCGSGLSTRNRTCLGGNCEGQSIMRAFCTSQECPDGVWTEWTNWACSVTCGTGMRLRARECNGTRCVGTNAEAGTCSLPACSSGENWGAWDSWGTCSVTCGAGIRRRSRVCVGQCSEQREIVDERCDAGDCPVVGPVGLWAPWQDYGPCSVTCGKGIKRRERRCLGMNCIGGGVEEESCTQRSCEERGPGSPGTWRLWERWGECSNRCGQGFRTRRRSCETTNCEGEDEERDVCVGTDCAPKNQWLQWLPWQRCSASCGPGTRRRQRTCEGPDCTGTAEETETCNNVRCNERGPNQPACRAVADIVFVVDSSGSIEEKGKGNWQLLLNFLTEVVDKLQVGQTQIRVSLIQFSGNSYLRFKLSDHNDKQTAKQSIQSLPYLSGSTNTQAAIKQMREEAFSFANGNRPDVPDVGIIITDGESTEFADRTIPEANLAKKNNITLIAVGVTHNISISELRNIASSPDHVYVTPDFAQLPAITDTLVRTTCVNIGESRWRDWTEWSSCSVTCGDGIRRRERQCRDPPCEGSGEESVTCNMAPCPTSGNWNQWTTWSECSVTCGQGTQNRQRTCTGDGCEGDAEETTECNTGACGRWGEWTDWSRCSVTCGQGTQKRQRGCTGDGCEGDAEETTECNAGACGHWGKWTDWSRCSVTCGQGTQKRQRTCTGDGCEGDAEETTECNAGACGRWDEWTEWSGCSVTCGEGVQKRQRTCTGDGCEGDAEETTECRAGACVSGWNSWGEWGECSVTCDFGVQSRRRICPASAICPGSTVETGRCILASCNGCSNLLDLAILVDSSGSINDKGPGNWELVKSFLKEQIAVLDVGRDRVRVSVVLFSNNARIWFNLNEYAKKEDIENAIDNLPYIGGTTNTQAALKLTRTDVFQEINGDRQNVNNAIVVLTDGESNVNRNNTIPEAMRSKRQGTQIIAIAVTNDTNRQELEGIASKNDWIFHVETFSSLSNVLTAVTTATCATGTAVWESWQHWGSCDCNTQTRSRSRICGGDNCIGDTTESGPCEADACTDTSGNVCRAELDLCFVVDSSGSINQNDNTNWGRVKDFTRAVASNLDIGSQAVRVSVVQFAEQASLYMKLSDGVDKTDVLSKLDNMPYISGGTNTQAALAMITDQVFTVANGDRPGVPNLAIVITDGESNIRQENTIPEANRAKRNGIVNIAIGVTQHINQTELEGIASNKSNVITVQDFASLQSIIQSVVQQACPTSGTWSNWSPWSQCTVSCGGGSQVRTRQCSTTGDSCIGNREERRLCNRQSCDVQCQAKADIAFVVDSSGSINEADPGNWDLVKRFLISAVNSFDIGHTGIRTGLIQFADDAKLIYDFDENASKDETTDFIMGLPYLSGGTNTQDALRIMHEQLFTPARGDRQDASDICIVLTDGQSTTRAGNTIPEAKKAKARGIKMVAIGVTDQVNQTELEGIASSKDLIFNVENFGQLESILSSLINLTCDAIDDWRSWGAWDACSQTCGRGIQRRTRTCRTNNCRGNNAMTRGCMNGPCDTSGQNCSEVVDLTLVVDASGSINQKDARNWGRVKSFLVNLTNRLDVSPNGARVSLIQFAAEAKQIFDLDEYTTRGEVANAINNLAYTSGGTNTQAALKLLTESAFTAQSGDRRDVPNMAIVLTDGESTVLAGNTLREARRVHAANISVFAIGVTNEINRTELNGIATKKEWVYEVANFTALENLAGQIINITCTSLQREYGPWGAWGTCDCTTNSRTRTRPCRGNSCPKTSEGSICPADACGQTTDQYGPWGAWGTCNCSTDMRTRTRSCTGNNCQRTTEMESCPDDACGQPSGQYGSWGPWGTCDCTINMQTRTRSCTGSNCPRTTETRSCPAGACSERLTDCQDLIDLCFVVDASGSINERDPNNWERVLNFTSDVASSLNVGPDGTRVAAVQFSGSARVYMKLSETTTKDEVVKKLKAMPYTRGGTNTQDALRLVVEQVYTPANGDRSNAKDIVVVITDGKSNIRPERTIPRANDVKNKGILVVAIGVTDRVDMAEIEGIATNKSLAFQVDSFSSLANIIQRVAMAACPTRKVTEPEHPWGSCSASCGNGRESKMCGNGTCSRDCYLRPCGVNQWTHWTAWCPCSKTCGQGFAVRERKCDSFECKGHHKEAKVCYGPPCDQPSRWGEWAPWSTCTATCGPGFQNRARVCELGQCVGLFSQTSYCTIEACQGQWGGWGSWGACSKKCGPGYVQSFRVCRKEPCDGAQTRSKICQIRDCVSDWGEWGPWGPCEGGRCDLFNPTGIRSRTRTCTGDGCSKSTESETVACQMACPVVWAGWGLWGACSMTCGNGVQERIRGCDSNCASLVSDNNDNKQTRMCNMGECIGVWGAWNSWGSCSQSCGEGQQMRTRPCSTSRCYGISAQSQNCLMRICRGTWTEWQPWSRCSRTCGVASRERTRQCNNGLCEGLSKQTQDCNLIACLGSWGPWAQWTVCDVTCGIGSRSRNRDCEPSNCRGQRSESDSCDMGPCGTWGAWATWGSCSTTCNEGMREKIRDCIGSGCQGENRLTKTCFPQPCEGRWMEWGQWSRCNATCGTGIRSRRRSCDEQNCIGEDLQLEPCSDAPCIGRWGQWGSWSDCSRSCGGGEQTRTRRCDSNNCLGEDMNRRRCNLDSCVDEWEQWSTWTACSPTCGPTRTRMQSRRCGGSNCLGERSRSERCNQGPSCGFWGSWGSWTQCSATCDFGTRERRRQCSSDDCPGQGTELNPCIVRECLGNWLEWSFWSTCSDSCGRGTTERVRRCDQAVCDGSAVETKECVTECIGRLSPWTPWESCSQSCGPGRQLRRRSCSRGPCQGALEETQPCNYGICFISGSQGRVCGGQLYAHMGKQPVMSPNYQLGPYPVNTDCTWSIRSLIPNTIILVNMTAMDIDCIDDSWTMEESTTQGVGETFRVCGHLATSAASVYASRTKLAVIKFSSGPFSTGTNKGFRFEFWAAPIPAKCASSQQVLEQSLGVVTSPNYGYNRVYPSDTICKWLLKVPTGKKVNVTFTSFDVLCLDYVSFSNDPGLTPANAKRYCNPNDTVQNKYVISASNELLVNFVSKGRLVGSGFRAEYQAVDENVDDHDSLALSKNTKSNRLAILEETEDVSFLVDLEFKQIEPQWDMLPGCGLPREKQWPWHVTITHQEKLSCAGVVVSKYWVLTVASCVYSFSTKQYLEASSLRIVTGSEQYEVHSIVGHPEFDAAKEENNVALLSLRKPLYVKDAAPACLPILSNVQERNCFILQISDQVPEVHAVNVSAYPQCRNSHPQLAKFMTKDQICVSQGPSADQMCMGQAGSSIVCEVNGRYHVHGLSLTPGTICPNTATVFLDVTVHSQWMKRYII